jgi:hypothetical protein
MSLTVDEVNSQEVGIMHLYTTGLFTVYMGTMGVIVISVLMHWYTKRGTGSRGGSGKGRQVTTPLIPTANRKAYAYSSYSA